MTAQAAQAGQADFGFNQAMGVDSSTGPQQLAGCLNEGYEPRNMSWEQALNDYLAALKVSGSCVQLACLLDVCVERICICHGRHHNVWKDGHMIKL